MKIPFRRITSLPQNFEVTEEGSALEGTMVQKERGLVFIDAHLNGRISVTCDRCAEEFDIMSDEKVELLVSDGLYNGTHDDYDVIEMPDEIDLDALIHSEIELVRSDYHVCEQCQSQAFD